MTLRPVGSTAARVALHRSARSMGYKLSKEGTDPRSFLWVMCVCCLSKECVCRFCLRVRLVRCLREGTGLGLHLW
jgi:hypothetical protein